MDLVVRHDGGVVLGKRPNEPARGEWFVPGEWGQKTPRLDDAVHRIAETELGCDVTIDRRLGASKHVYDTSEFADVDANHDVANGFVVYPKTDTLTPDDQHADLQVFEPLFPDLYPYVDRYLSDALDSPAG